MAEQQTYYKATSPRGGEYLTTSKSEHVRLLASGYKDTTDSGHKSEPKTRKTESAREPKGTGDGST